MIFKPSSIRKLFFTYICPTFYGSPPSAPSNTTSTQTINQSPWQNPVYQALMLGTADKPGPITSMLRSSAEQTAAWNAMNAGGYSPVPIQNQYTEPYTPPVAAPATPTIPTAAQGGIMSLEGYASGGEIKAAAKVALGREFSDFDTNALMGGMPGASYDQILNYFKQAPEGVQYAQKQEQQKQQKQQEYDKLTPAQKATKAKELQDPVKGETAEQHAARVQELIDLGGTPNKTNTSFMQNYADSKTNKWSGNIDPTTGQMSLRPKGVTESTADYQKYVDAQVKNGATAPKSAAEATAASNLKNTLGTAVTNVTADTTPVYDAKGNITGYKSTNQDFLDLQAKAKALGMPSQFGAATNMYNQSSAGLAEAAKYKPTDIAAKKADVAGATATGYGAKNMEAPTNIAAQKGNVANAAAVGYDASSMNAPKDIAAQRADVAGVKATGYNAANMNAPKDIAAQKANVATMQGAGDVASDKLQQYQMQGPEDINAPTAKASQMAGPKSWIDKGTSEAYMSPYMQNVVDIQKREANRDYQQQLNQLNAQSVQAGAFGGSRQAIQQAEAARNQAIRLGDIEAKGLQEAYASGMGQFTNEQGQQLQAGQANLSASQQTSLANQSAMLQAMMTNQGMDYNTALQNLQAKLGVQNTASSQDLQAALANQQTQQQTQSTNMAAQNQAQQAYVQQALAAAQANQGAQLTAAQQNQIAQNAAAQYTASNQQQANISTQQAQNQASQAYVQQALAAAQANQGTALTAAQQNQIAKNAAAQYNATNTQNVNLTNAAAKNQAEQAYVQQALVAAQANYGGQLTAAQQNQVAQNASAQYNATNQQNVNLSNQGAQNAANNAYVQNQLAAQQANQQAGLTANQQGIAALQGVGQNASGLTSTGTAANQAGIANLGAQGQVVQAEQALSQQGVTNNQQTALNALGATNQINSGAVAAINAQPVQGGTQIGTVNAPKARGGLIRNGKVSKRGVK